MFDALYREPTNATPFTVVQLPERPWRWAWDQEILTCVQEYWRTPPGLPIDFDSRRRRLFTSLGYLSELVDVEALELLKVGSDDAHAHNVLRCVSAHQSSNVWLKTCMIAHAVSLPCRSPRE